MIQNEQPDLRYVPASGRGIVYLGATDALHIRGCDLYAWENKGSAQFLGVHLPNIKSANLVDGIVKLAGIVNTATKEGYLVSYELPSHIGKSEKGKYRKLDLEEITALRKAQGLPQLKIAA